MIVHYLKLLWKRRRRHTLLFLEFVFTFFILIAVLHYTLNKVKYMNEPMGFDSENQYIANIQFDRELLKDSAGFFNLTNKLKLGLKSLPEVETVSVSNYVYPYGNAEWYTNNESDNFSYRTCYTQVDEEAINAYNLNMVAGRFYTKADYIRKKVPIVVNQAFVDTFMEGKDPVGFVLTLHGEDAEIIGVTEAFKYNGIFLEGEPFTFYPLNYSWGNSAALVIDMKPGTPATVQKEMHEILKKELKHENFSLTTLDDLKQTFNNRFWVPLIGMLSVSLFLIINIAMGLFGTLRYAINKRKSEIGLRKVLGATTRNIRFQVVGEVILLMILAFFVALIPAVQIFEFGNLITDYSTFITSIALSLLLILILVLICSIIPSQRASKLMPAVALHEE
ncbi:ABC transporter permease [Zhouia amylolytica]|uniref:ABC transporter permease n=1 Tax=Zhouia amylolytica TaxID=376730 RepID=UPI0020CFB292|nr:FtsX-like permease family protein [Zhouia amylolytica]MCQ0112080.1 ABC transporter permease [Zhouia amylolytica]